MEERPMSSLSDKTGGPAFPEAFAVGPAGDVCPSIPGMSLRDYFAAACLSGVMTSAVGLANMRPEELRKSFDEVARVLYVAADAMIAARQEPQS
jgi:hypothetical protein